jgi:hypothetical protein
MIEPSVCASRIIRLQPAQPVGQEVDQSVTDRSGLHAHLDQGRGEEATARKGVTFRRSAGSSR